MSLPKRPKIIRKKSKHTYSRTVEEMQSLTLRSLNLSTRSCTHTHKTYWIRCWIRAVQKLCYRIHIDQDCRVSWRRKWRRYGRRSRGRSRVSGSDRHERSWARCTETSYSPRSIVAVICNSTSKTGSNSRRGSLKGFKEVQVIIIVWRIAITGVLGA